jgi:hypothetical protein
MGSVHPSIPFALAERLRDRFDISSFVETGTYLGETSSWAADRFERVWTIEAHRPLYERAVEMFKSRNVSVVFGDSARALRQIVSGLTGSCMFWLDAHYSGAGTAGERYECPLLAEIAAIDASPFEHFVLIDDARMFLSPPPPPHRPEQWPRIRAVTEALHARRPNDHIVIFEDVIYRIPASAKAAFADMLPPDPHNRRAFLRALYSGQPHCVWLDEAGRAQVGTVADAPLAGTTVFIAEAQTPSTESPACVDPTVRADTQHAGGSGGMRPDLT